MDSNRCSYKTCANRIGLFLAALFVVCFIWYYLRPVEQGLHLSLFKMSFFGFSGMNVRSFILGLIQSYIWGYIGVGVWWLIGGCRKDKQG